MDLCRANERNAAALTLTSIGQQETSSSSSASAAGGAANKSASGATWLVVDNNNASGGATSPIVAQETVADPEPNNNVGAMAESWTKQPTVLEDGNVVYDMVTPAPTEGTQSK